MSIMDRFLTSMKLMPEGEDMDFEDEDDEDIYSSPKITKAKKSKSDYDDYDDYGDGPLLRESTKKPKNVKVVPMKSSNKNSEVRMIIPKGYEDADQIADFLLDGKSVVLNLEGMNIDAAQRVIDFATGACYTIGGNLQKISKKIFIVTPDSVELSGDFTDMINDNIDLSALNLNL